MENTCDITNWSLSEVEQWLCDINFESYVDLFCNCHKIDGEALSTLTENDLRLPPIQIPILGDIKRLGIALRKIQHQQSPTIQTCHQIGGNKTTSSPTQDRRDSFAIERSNSRHVQYNGNIERSDTFDDEYLDSSCDSCEYPKVDFVCKDLPREPLKTLLSFIYVLTVFGITSFVMVIVHDRVPDMDKYPPLPDLFLDNMPYVPWAFECCEVIAVMLSTIWITILCFHKHRFILLRRMFSLAGTIFMLRSVSMLITSLSVPGIHLNCQGTQMKEDMWSKLNKALVIWRGMGMAIQGVRSCGDYMFSGHTVIITILNFFITEYTPQTQMYFLHIISWVLNLFGIFFILAAHEHYSIDVFIAFYITSRLFLYYHTLANNRGLLSDTKRTKVWFPLFSFFESKCDGRVPNEYEWPLGWPMSFKQYFQFNNNLKQK